MGQGQRAQSCFNRHSQAHNVSSRPEEDCCCTKSTMGEVENTKTAQNNAASCALSAYHYSTGSQESAMTPRRGESSYSRFAQADR
jgi:hypothetical protein